MKWVVNFSRGSFWMVEGANKAITEVAALRDTTESDEEMAISSSSKKINPTSMRYLPC